MKIQFANTEMLKRYRFYNFPFIYFGARKLIFARTALSQCESTIVFLDVFVIKNLATMRLIKKLSGKSFIKKKFDYNSALYNEIRSVVFY